METREDFCSGTPRILPALRILVQLVKLCLITRTMIWSQLSRVGREGQVIVEQCKLPNQIDYLPTNLLWRVIKIKSNLIDYLPANLQKIKSCRISDVTPPIWVGWKTTGRRGWLAFYWTCAAHVVPSVCLWFQVCHSLLIHACHVCVCLACTHFLVLWWFDLLFLSYEHLFNGFLY